MRSTETKHNSVFRLLPLLIAVLFLFCGCTEWPVDPDLAVRAAETAAELFSEGDYETIAASAPEGSGITVEALEEAAFLKLEKHGRLQNIKDSSAAPETIDGVPCTVITIVAHHEKGKIVYRVAFDRDLNLIRFTLD